MTSEVLLLEMRRLRQTRLSRTSRVNAVFGRRPGRSAERWKNLRATFKIAMGEPPGTRCAAYGFGGSPSSRSGRVFFPPLPVVAVFPQREPLENQYVARADPPTTVISRIANAKILLFAQRSEVILAANREEETAAEERLAALPVPVEGFSVSAARDG